jgi:hypothetical protein
MNQVEHKKIASLLLISVIGVYGCSSNCYDGPGRLAKLPPAEEISCVRVLSRYWYDAGNPHKIGLSEEGLAWLRRLRDGTATSSDAYGTALAREAWGTVLEITDRSEVTSIVHMLQDGLEQAKPSTLCGTFCLPIASIHIEWLRSSDGFIYIVSWWSDREFIVNCGTRHELLFESQELADLLARLAQSQSLRVWEWSHPELQKPIVWPE